MGLANITEQLAPGGFLLAYEATKPLPVFAWGLDKVTWNFTDEREYGLWMSPQRWHAQLAAAGLVMVSEHTCVSKYATMNRCMHRQRHSPYAILKLCSPVFDSSCIRLEIILCRPFHEDMKMALLKML